MRPSRSAHVRTTGLLLASACAAPRFHADAAVVRGHLEVFDSGDVARLAEFVAPGHAEVYRGAVHIRVSGTHTGSWFGEAPTGQRLEFHGVGLDRVVDGRIVEHAGAADLLAPLLEAGALRLVERED